MNVTPNVIKLECTKNPPKSSIASSVYAVKGDGVTLIDTSWPGLGAAILEELQSEGIHPGDIQRIFLTHGDADHTGNAAYIAEKTGCKVFISVGELPYVTGKKNLGVARLIFSTVMKVKLPKTLVPFPTDTMNGFEILATPGHTPGHTCFRFENILFVGDLISNDNGVIVTSPRRATWNAKLLLDSCRNLNLDGVDWICPAHGKPVGVQAWERFAQQWEQP
jgi:glyoxylase-like metal-dependent hydrolase (beta-lactamase superfamily II)